MFCFHKYSQEIVDGYQACLKCGKKIPVPCNHKWLNKSTIQVECDYCDYTKYVLQCEKCGEITFKKV